MGTENISFEINKKATRSEIEAAFKRQQNEDRSYNGTRDGYSGDFQTVSGVKDHTHMIFNSQSEAEDYCLEQAKKWEFVVAVYYRDAKYVPSKKVQKLQDKIKDLTQRLAANATLTFKMPAFKTCEGCDSKVNTSKMRGHKCPVCHEGDFRPLSHQRSEVSFKAKIAEATAEREALVKAEREKASAKGEIKTLIAGWGAC